MNQHVVLGADHEGVALKEQIKQKLQQAGYSVEDIGTAMDQPVDYPTIAAQVAQLVSNEPDTSKGILVCATGIGMSMVANRFPKVLAGQVWSEEMAARSREDD